MIPPLDLEKRDDLKLIGSIFVSEEFLFLLFIIAFGETRHEVRRERRAAKLAVFSALLFDPSNCVGFNFISFFHKFGKREAFQNDCVMN